MAQVNYTIPLYFDQSLSYLELVGNLSEQMQEVKDKTDELLEAISYDKTNEKVVIDGDLDVSGTISGDIEISGGTVIADLQGNADTATKLETARTISLGGDASGSASFDGSANVTINADVSHADASDEASKLSTARNIQLIGDVTGVASFDGSGNIQMQTTIQGTTPQSITTIPNDLTLQGDLTVRKEVSGALVEKGIIISAGNITLASGYHVTGDVVGNVTGNVTGSCTGNAATATKLTTNDVGSATLPVYFDEGIPVVCGNSLAVSITGNAATATQAAAATTATSATSAVTSRGTTAIQYGTDDVSEHTFPTGYTAQAGDVYFQYTE